MAKLTNIRISIGGTSKGAEMISGTNDISRRIAFCYYSSAAIGGPLAVLRDGDLVQWVP